MSKLQNLHFYDILPQSIKEDGIISAVSSSLDELLCQTALASTNLLIYARLRLIADLSDKMLPALERMAAAQGGLKPLSLAELEQLAWQFHVDFREVAKSNDELANMVKNSIEWHRLKGTPAGMKLAFALFGMQIGIEEHALGTHWASYQLDLGQVDDVNVVKLAWKISQEMQPVRCKLFRMYTDEYNISPLIYSEGNYSEHFYSFFSGVSAGVIGDDWENGQGDDLQLSFGTRLAFETEKLKHFKNAKFFGSARQGFEVPYLDYPLWSYFSYSDAFTEKHGFIITQTLCFDATQKIYSSGTWQGGTWAKHPWAISFIWDRPLPKWSMFNDAISRSQLIYSDAFAEEDDFGYYSGLNSCYSLPNSIRYRNPFNWGKSRYSDDALDEQIIIHKFELESKGISSQPLELQSINTAVSIYNGFEIPYIDSLTWSNFSYSDPIFESIRLISQEHFATSTECNRQLPTWNMSGLEQIGIQAQFTNNKPISVSIQRIGFETKPLHNTTWSGSWASDERSWYDYIAYYSVTSISK